MELLDFISSANEKTRQLIKSFRIANGNAFPDSYSAKFYEFRFNNPFFGYVEVANDGCSPFYMLTNNDDLVAQHYLWYGKNGYEVASLREWVMRAKSARVVFDIGAHTGLFSLVARGSNPQIEKVVAFEPTARASSRIIENLIVNHLVGRIDVERMAISDRPGTLEFMHYDDLFQIGTGASYLGTEKTGPVQSMETCTATTIDAYIDKIGNSPDLLKIDVEGAEGDALRGAQSLIARCTATFLIEVLPSTVQTVVDLLPGYEIFVVDDEANRTVPFRPELVKHYTNILVCPK